MEKVTGEFFEDSLQKEIREKFYYVDEDPEKGKRIFFENSGGSLRLKKCVEVKEKLEKIPDCPERIHERALYLKEIQKQGTEDVLKVMFGAKTGSLVTELTASQTMFQIVHIIMENTAGTNAVTTAIEHPSAYDSVKFYCEKTGKEFRVAQANKKTGGIDVKEIQRLVDKDTCLLSVMSASNISGTIMDLEAIVKAAREINPDIYIISDAVQHAPHGVMDVEKCKLDAINFAPYKCFGTRGIGFAYVSDRVASLPHHKLLAKDPDVWELGTPTPSNFAIATEIVNHVCWIGEHYVNSKDRRTLYATGMEKIHLHERALLERLLNGTKDFPGLRKIDGVTVFVDTDDLTKRDLIVAMAIDGLDYTKTVEEYQKRGVTVYERVNTSLYSKRIVEALGLDGAVRVSPLHCHSGKDIDEFLLITKSIVEELSK